MNCLYRRIIKRICYRYICCTKNIDLQQDNNSQSSDDDKEISIKYTWSDTKPFIPPITQGYVIKVYDGDTITIATKLPYDESPLYRFSVRLNGIDCPEIKGKNALEKQVAHYAKMYVSDKVLHKTIYLDNVKTEKYGRVLADVYINPILQAAGQGQEQAAGQRQNESLSQMLLRNGLAVEYDGGTKNVPDNWMNHYLSLSGKSGITKIPPNLSDISPLKFPPKNNTGGGYDGGYDIDHDNETKNKL